MLEEILRGLGEVSIDDKPRVRVWPPQLSTSGFAPTFFRLTKKPDPEGLRALMDEAHVRPEETVMIGDSEVDVQTARNAGTWAVGCTFGLAPHTLEAAPPDMLTDSPADWTEALAIEKIIQERNEVA